MKGEIPMKSGDEYDALTGWRRVLSFKPGKRKRIKSAFRRRVRRIVRKILRQETTDDR